MLYCNKHFEVEFLKVEKYVQYIGIPIFTILTVFFLTPFPFDLVRMHFLFHLICSFLGIVSIWYSVRFISFLFRKYFHKWNFTFRLIAQLVFTSATTVLITYVLTYFGENFFAAKFGLCADDNFDFDHKNLYITSILFTFLINTLYESFYLFLRLSDNALETERYKKESIEAQYQNLTSRLNPHFLFNSLNTLTAIVEEEPKKAVEYIRELSLVYRYVLNSQKSTWIDIPSELKFTRSYILLLKMRFENNLEVTLELCDNHLNYYILPLTIQLLIENAVKHNEISDDHTLNIKIYCDNELLIVVNNKQKRTIMPSTTKIGLQNIRERYRFLINKEVIINDTNDSFTVKIPLVKIIKNDSEQSIQDDFIME